MQRTKFLMILIFLALAASPAALILSQTTEDEDVPECVSGYGGASTLADALTALQAVRQERRNAGDRAGEAGVLYCMGLVYFAQGSYPAIQQPFRDARTQFERALLA